MNIVIFTDGTPTREFRFLKREVLLNWRASNLGQSIELVSDINPFSNWFDVTTDSIDWKKSKYLFVDNDVLDDFYAFIDRIEENNFNTNSFRVFFTVDWWSTVQHNYENADSLLKHIRGTVSRAHVNDWKDNGDGTISIDLSNTDNRIEEEVVAWKNQSSALCDSLLDSHAPDIPANKRIPVQFLYVLFKRNTEEVPQTEYPCISHDSTGDLTIPVPYGVAIIPAYRGKFLRFNLNNGDDYYNTSVTTYPVTCITGVTPVIMFISYTFGGDWVLKKDGDNYYIHFNISDLSVLKSFDVDTGDSGVAYGVMYKDIPPSLIPCNNVIEDSIVPYSDTKFNKSNISISWFNDNGMAKAISEPYIICGLSGQKSGIIIHPQYMVSSDNIEVIMSLNTGVPYVRVNDNSYLGLSQVFALPGDNTFVVWTEQTAMDERLARFNAISSVLQPVISGVKDLSMSGIRAGADFIGGDIVSGINNVVQQPFNIAQRGIEVAKGVMTSQIVFRNLALGGNVQLSPNYEGATFAVGAFKENIIYPLYANNWGEIKEHLRLYGYTTYLEPRDILTNHVRSNFNFIKCDYCYFDNYVMQIEGELPYLSLNDEIKNSILQMFMDGVFLFNTTSFDLNVVNMQEGILE